MAIREFRLPDPGEGLVEADIVTWRVAVGDEVKINDIVVEVETSKSLVELPTPYAGTVSALLVAEGETVEVGSPIIAIDDGVAAEPGAAPSRRTWPWSPPRDGHGSDGTGGRGRIRRAGRHAGRLRTQDHRGEAAAAQADRCRSRARAGARDDGRHLRHRLAGVPAGRRARAARSRPAAADRRTAAGARPGRARARAQRWRGAGQAASAQAGQGSRGRPEHDHRQRSGRSDHPRRRAAAAHRESMEGAGARDLSIPPNQAPRVRRGGPTATFGFRSRACARRRRRRWCSRRSPRRTSASG